MKNIFSISRILIFTFFLYSCKKIENNQSAGVNLNEESKIYQSENDDDFTHLKEDFYQNKSGNIFEKRTFAIAGTGETFDGQEFYDSIIEIPGGDSVIEKSIQEILDIKTFERIGESAFSKDKNNVYYSYHNTGGGSRLN